MKTFLALGLSLFATVSMACTDFTGSYRSQQDSSTYSIQQSGCTSITSNTNEGTMTVLTDGQYRVSEDNEHARILTAAKFVGSNLTIDGKIEYKQPLPSEIPAEMIPTKIVMIVVKDSAGNLVTTSNVLNSDDQVLGSTTTTDQKI